jgi:hypothetical protein
MRIGARIRHELARRAPRLEEAAVQANWRRRNRTRAFSPARVTDPSQQVLVAALSRDGFAVTSFEELFGDRSMFDEAARHARRLYEDQPSKPDATAGTKATYLTKLAAESFEADDPFVRIALHPAALNVANGYLRLRSSLRALELWHTRPSPGPAVQTQLWHRDADDVMNVKMFVYFTDVRPSAGPLTYVPGTHPLGDRRRAVAEHDAHGRSNDGQMATVVPEPEWRVLEGGPGTIVFADTCGYHKQLKPESEERIALMAHYVSGTPYVPRVLELRAVEPAALSEDQHYAVFDAPPAR